MNKLILIGNLTKAPELKATPSGVQVCNFDIAVNRRAKQGEQPLTDYFRVTAWRQLGENCARYLAKGRKVCVTGPVSCRAYIAGDGSARAQMEITAEDVEFLSPRNEGESIPAPAYPAPQPDSMIPVETDELPF